MLFPYFTDRYVCVGSIEHVKNVNADLVVKEFSSIFQFARLISTQGLVKVFEMLGEE